MEERNPALHMDQSSRASRNTVEAPKFSATKKIKNLLGRAVADLKNFFCPRVTEVRESHSVEQSPPPFPINSLSLQQPAWSVQAHMMAIQSRFPPSTGSMIPPHRPSPLYPNLYPPRYSSHFERSTAAEASDVDEWSRDENPGMSTNSASIPETAVESFSMMPGELPINSIDIIRPYFSSENSSSFTAGPIGSFPSDDIESSQSNSSANNNNNYNNSNKNDNNNNDDEDENSVSDSTELNADESPLKISNMQCRRYSSEAIAFSADVTAETYLVAPRRYALRPVSSTTVFTPTVSGVTNLPGTLQEVIIESNNDPSSSAGSEDTQNMNTVVPNSSPNESSSRTEAASVLNRLEARCSSCTSLHDPSPHAVFTSPSRNLSASMKDLLVDLDCVLPEDATNGVPASAKNTTDAQKS